MRSDEELKDSFEATKNHPEGLCFIRQNEILFELLLDIRNLKEKQKRKGEMPPEEDLKHLMKIATQ